MKAKALILGLICFFIFAYCESPADPEIKKALNPVNPEPIYEAFEFEITISVALADETPFLAEGDYCHFYLYIAGFQMSGILITDESPNGSVSSTVKISLISTFQEEVMSVDCELAMTRISMGEWLKSAQFIWTLKLVPITEGFVFSPAEQQMTITGWAEREVKAIYFTLIKE